VLVGSKTSKIQETGHGTSAMYGLATRCGLERMDAERLLRQLVIQGVLDEELHVSAHDHAVCYVKVGGQAAQLLNGSLKVSHGGRNCVVRLGRQGI